MNENSLFARFGVELEYMIVDAETLDVRAIAEEFLSECGAGEDGDVERGPITWCNELAAHVLELKTTSPPTHLDGVDRLFQHDINDLQSRLAGRGCRLLPSAMHPWMHPERDTRLWSKGNREIYEAFDRLFGCTGHGWTNLQSVHLNLPFSGDDEFARLHTAIRMLLPLLPALAASSPFADERRAPALDYRLEVYRTNCRRIPEATARVIPAPIRSIQEYHDAILDPLYRALKPHDPEGILQYEWANARGAIARFDRDTIEIRVLDVQECPIADLAIVRFIVEILKALASERFSSLDNQLALETESLAAVLLDTIRDAETAVIRDGPLLDAFGFGGIREIRAGELFSELAKRLLPTETDWSGPIRHILNHGTLASRIVRATGQQPDRHKLREVYRSLGRCLEEGTLFG